MLNGDGDEDEVGDVDGEEDGDVDGVGVDHGVGDDLGVGVDLGVGEDALEAAGDQKLQWNSMHSVDLNNNYNYHLLIKNSITNRCFV